MLLVELVAEVEAQFAAQAVLVLVLVHEEVKAQEAVVEMADVLGIADEVVKVVLEAQVAQVAHEAQEVLEAQEVEVLEVQDHPSRRLLPDHAALAHLAHRPEVLRRQGLQEHRRHREAGQRH